VEAAADANPGEGQQLLEVLGEGARAVEAALHGVGNRRRRGRRPGQYALDLVADDAVCAVLHRAGLAVVSEESGRTGPATSKLLVVVDPVDGSTNASIGIPWFATSLCVLDDVGPLASLVVNLASGVHYDAVRHTGARRDGTPIRPSGCEKLSSAIVGISGFPARHPGWSQYRAMGSAALDICAVAEGVLDGYRVAGGTTLSGWDYLAAAHICMEAGGVAGELGGEDLVVRDDSPRRPAAASTPALMKALVAADI
jgi:myo-inositol-1(or 4)-monophosphatase